MLLQATCYLMLVPAGSWQLVSRVGWNSFQKVFEKVQTLFRLVKNR